jgi:hypothetical protein
VHVDQSISHFLFPAQNISEVLRNPSLLPNHLQVQTSSNQEQAPSEGLQPPQKQDSEGQLVTAQPAAPKPIVSAHFLERLQQDVTRSCLADCSYSPYADIAKQATGARDWCVPCVTDACWLKEI